MKSKNISIVLSTIALVVSLVLLIAWCAVSFNLEPLYIAQYESVVVSVLGILVTLLMGWNIYTIIDVKQVRQDMLESKREVERLEVSFQTKSKRQTSLLDAYAFMGLSEMFLAQGRYVQAYLKILSSILCFENADEHNLAQHECKRMYMLVRTIRRQLAIKQNDYVLDYDLYNDVAYGKDLAELSLLNLEPFSVVEMRDIFMYLMALATKQIPFSGAEFTLYDRDADIKRRPLAIYLLLEKGKVLYKTMDYDKYYGILTYDLNLNHDTIAIAEFTSKEKCKKVYEKIDVREINEYQNV